MRFISNEKLDALCFKNRLIPPKLRRSLYASAEITGFQPATPTTFKAIGNKNKLFELKYFQEWNQPESVRENVGLQIFNALQMLPKNEDSSVGRARQILADGIRYQAELRETNIRVAKEKVSSELAAVFKAKKARLNQAAEFLKQQEEQDETALQGVNQALKALDEVANLAEVKVEPTPPPGPPPGGLRGRIRSVEPEEPGAAEIKQGDPEPPPETGVKKTRRRTDEERRQKAEEVMVTTTEELEKLRKQLADKKAIGPPYGPRLQSEITGLEKLIKKDEEKLAKEEAKFERLTEKIEGKSEMEPPMPQEPLETPMPEQEPGF